MSLATTMEVPFSLLKRLSFLLPTASESNFFTDFPPIIRHITILYFRYSEYEFEDVGQVIA